MINYTVYCIVLDNTPIARNRDNFPYKTSGEYALPAFWSTYTDAKHYLKAHFLASDNYKIVKVRIKEAK